MSAHIHAYTYIRTRIQNVHMNARKARLKRRRGSEAQLDAKKLCPYPCPLQSGGGYPSWPAAQLPVHEKRRISAEQPQPTADHRTITTARRPDHIRVSALVRSRSTQFIVHASSKLGRGPPKRGHFPAILAGSFSVLCVHFYMSASEYVSARVCVLIVFVANSCLCFRPAEVPWQQSYVSIDFFAKKPTWFLEWYVAIMEWILGFSSTSRPLCLPNIYGYLGIYIYRKFESVELFAWCALMESST